MYIDNTFIYKIQLKSENNNLSLKIDIIENKNLVFKVYRIYAN